MAMAVGTVPNAQAKEVRFLTSHIFLTALAQRGYHIQVEDEIEGWTPLDPVRHLSIKLDQALIDIVGYRCDDSYS